MRDRVTIAILLFMAFLSGWALGIHWWPLPQAKVRQLIRELCVEVRP